ncbi:SLC13 family permease, partial [Streptomyces sp. DT18]
DSLAREAALPDGNLDQLLADLIVPNVGPLVTPWASLATLLWFARCRTAGVKVPLARFVGTGLGLAVTGTAAATGALVLTS